MPFKSETIKLPRTLDRRVKLTETERAEIKWTREATGESYGSLARKYGVSKRLIMFICNPEMEAKCKEQAKKRRQDGRYKPIKEGWASTMREHRQYKQQLFKEGKI